MTENKTPVPGLVLTAEQVQALAKFAKEDVLPEYCITHFTIPAFVAEDDSEVPEYTGLIAYTELKDHAVLELDYALQRLLSRGFDTVYFCLRIKIVAGGFLPRTLRMTAGRFHFSARSDMNIS